MAMNWRFKRTVADNARQEDNRAPARWRPTAKHMAALLLGMLLIVIGTAVISYQGITFATVERHVRMGPLEAVTHPSNWTLRLPPVVGIVLLALGVALVLVMANSQRPARTSELSNFTQSKARKQVERDQGIHPLVG